MKQLRIIWTPEMDEQIRSLRAEKQTWGDVAIAVGIGLHSVRERAKRIGVAGLQGLAGATGLAHARAVSAAPVAERWTQERSPLPAGSAATWQALNSGLVIEGCAYAPPDPMRLVRHTDAAV